MYRNGIYGENLKKGFILIELVIVVVVLGILIGGIVIG